MNYFLIIYLKISYETLMKIILLKLILSKSKLDFLILHNLIIWKFIENLYEIEIENSAY